MSAKTNFPFFRRIFKKLTGRWARRIYVSILLFALCLATVARVRSYLMARKIQAVLARLAEIRVDETTEEQLLKAVPYLGRSERDGEVGGIAEHWRHLELSNESDWLVQPDIADGPDLLGKIARWLGYRYMSFDASVLVHDGRVSRVEYGFAKQWGRPRQVSYTVSAKSVHGFWSPYQRPLAVTSEDDESPQYRVNYKQVPTLRGHENGLDVTFTNDAPPELAKRAFQLNLSCFWRLRGCEDARDIAPGLWQDARAIRKTALDRLLSEKCPDSIIDGRMRYLPDISVLLLEVTGSRRIEVNEEGDRAEDWFTDYQLKEVFRGSSHGSWKNVRFRQTIPSPIDRTQTIANQIWPPTKIGSQVLFFGSLYFDSCRIIPATPSALEIIRKTPAPPRKPEDQVLGHLM